MAQEQVYFYGTPGDRDWVNAAGVTHPKWQACIYRFRNLEGSERDAVATRQPSFIFLNPALEHPEAA